MILTFAFPFPSFTLPDTIDCSFHIPTTHMTWFLMTNSRSLPSFYIAPLLNFQFSLQKIQHEKATLHRLDFVGSEILGNQINKEVKTYIRICQRRICMKLRYTQDQYPWKGVNSLKILSLTTCCCMIAIR